VVVVDVISQPCGRSYSEYIFASPSLRQNANLLLVDDVVCPNSVMTHVYFGDRCSLGWILQRRFVLVLGSWFWEEDASLFFWEDLLSRVAQ
jgi:hypothetical protein